MFNTPPLLFGAKKAPSLLFVLILLSSFTLFIIIILVIFLVCVYFNAHNFRWKSARKCSYDPLRVIFSTQWICKHTV